AGAAAASHHASAPAAWQPPPGGTVTPPAPSVTPAAPTPSPSPSTGSSTRPAAGPAAPARFATLPPGTALPSDQQCATWVRAHPYPENKGGNRRANQTTGQPVGTGFFQGDDPRAGTRIAARVDGQA